MLSAPHLIIVFIVVLVVFGPQKLPELARNLGKLLAEFRKASTDFKMAFEEEMRNIERQAREAEWKKSQAAAAAADQSAVAPLPAPAETPAAPAEAADPVISPVAEAVPRSSGTNPSPEPAELVPEAPSENALHDHEQPA
ncbi:MAG TPA: twin-arginine translocase TatA/TatE family subunit [Candidatus Acidoferrum sp.]|nr:twin-arginine translocase TatA/TatE family subunit [Candidatus Acidoferrum sp.]